VRGTEDMNLVACLFPYKTGYHLDMYAVFTKPEGGIMQWPRQLTGIVLGTPEKFTESTMMDIVRAIRESTGANVSLVEAKPNLAGTPWLEPGRNTASTGTGTGSGSATTPAYATPAAAPATAASPAAAPAAPAAAPAATAAPATSTTASASQAGSTTTGAGKPSSVPE
jgi:hypothetical protein